MEVMDLKIKEQLIVLAKKPSGHIDYQKLCEKCKILLDMDNDLDVKTLTKSLTKISEFEHTEGRPFLSAIVFDLNKRVPESDFFEMAERLGKYSGSENEKDKEIFFYEELDALYKEWQK